MREPPVLKVERGTGETARSLSEEDRQILDTARRVVRLEAECVADLADRLGDTFVRVVHGIRETEGRVVVTGVGKSGLVARKIASTLASTGTPALFLHPVEGVHGDLGVLLRGDLLIVVSRSGESRELEEFLAVVRRMDVEVIALTGRPDSDLGRRADLVLNVGVREEACPHDLTPTSSSTTALAMGDALAIAVFEQRNFGPDDFARFHPGGVLGRRLLLRVSDVMVTGSQLPSLRPEDELARAMHEIAHRRGTIPVVDEDVRVVGVITAGDLTRFGEEESDFLRHSVHEVMNRSPKVISEDALAVDALGCCQAHGIMALPVVDGGGHLAGMIHLHDLLRAGVA